jgi:hypothetical protein
VAEYWLYDKIFVLVKDPLPEYIDLPAVLGMIEQRIPQHLTYEVDSVYIGEFDEFIEREINSFYKNGAIFVTNQQVDNSDIVDDIIHEIAHAAEDQFQADIYMDQSVEEEFLGKRRRLYSMLMSSDVLKKVGKRIGKKFLNPKYDEEFDSFLYKRVGYPLLHSLTLGLFTNPYAITSLREYFASGFEYYFLEDKMYLQKVSPQLYYKLTELEELTREE